MERRDVGDRQLDALLERLERIADELERMNSRAEQHEGFALVAGELYAVASNGVLYRLS